MLESPQKKTKKNNKELISEERKLFSLQIAPRALFAFLIFRLHRPEL